MSLEAFTWALNETVGGGCRKLILMGLANHAHKDGTAAFPSRETLAEYAECDVKTVGRHLKALVRDGFIRLGDQRLVEHLRADRRPKVYDLALTDARRALWLAVEQPYTVADQAPAPTEERGDNLTPRSDTHDRTPCPPVAQATGGHLDTPRGDKAVSPEPSLNQEPPQPPSELGGASCTRHPDRPGVGCRACGTTPRQLADRRRAAATERRRLDDQAAAVRRRAEAEARRVGTETTTGRDRAALVRAAVVRTP